MDIKITSPLLPLRDIVVFPSMVIPLFVGRDKSISALNEVMKKDKKIILVTQKNSEIDDPKKTDIFMYGCEGSILQLLKLPDGTVKVLVEVNKRIKIVDFKDDKESNIARSAVIKEDGLYKMWFSYVTEGLKYRIGYSESKDFVNWKRMDEASGITISKDDFDSNMTCYPNLFSHKQDLFMLYNGNNFGKEGFALAKRII